MISVKNLKVKVWEKEIIKWISLDFEIWKNYLLLGKNWSGKSSLSSVIAGNPKYEVVDGEIEIKNVGASLVGARNTEIQNIGQIENIGQSQGLPLQEKNVGVDLVSTRNSSIDVSTQNLLEMSPDERSKAWIFLSFQNVPEIKWINLWEYLRIIYNIHLKNLKPESQEVTPFIFKRFIKQYLQEFCIDEAFLSRDLNVWFSGWEKRKIEMLQVKLIWPKYIILDEVDSWLDIDAFKTVAELLAKLDSPSNTFIIITHYFKIVDYFKIDKVYLLEDWKLKKDWWMEIVDEIKENWF